MAIVLKAFAVVASIMLSWYIVNAGFNHLERLEEAWCKERIAVGIVYFECRHYWDECPFYYQDCKNSEAKYEWVREDNHYNARRVP